MRCPNCSNDLQPAKGGGGFCPQCAEFFQSSALANFSAEVHYSKAAAPAARNFCKDLAARVNWPTIVFETWPAPLAHEAWRLKEILEEGQIIGAIWQLKDLAEVLLKFPAVIMARDLLEHGTDEAVKSNIPSFFFSRPLSMGHWLTLAGDLLTRAVLAENPERLTAPKIAGIFRQTGGKRKSRPTTGTYGLIREIIQWRNDELGHGAFRLNVGEFQPELESFITRFNAVFQEHEDQGLWSGLTLRVLKPEPVDLRGAASIRTRHENAVPGPHITEDADVALVDRDQTLLLSPFLTVKRCRVCRKMDLFFFDSKKADHFYFLDYLAGHRMARPGHLETRLNGQAREIKTVLEDMDENETMGRVARRTVDALLVEKSLEATYFSPAFLRTRLKEVVETQDKGIFWLRAPAHCGKSVFVNGLLPTMHVEPRPLTEGLKTAAFFIKREYRYHPAQFKEQLREAITAKNCLNLVAGSRELPELDLWSDDPGKAFTDWIGDLLRWRPNDTLLICIDGLDELAQTDDTSILKFIPSPDQLPERLYILLTSRPQDGCPDWVWQGLASKLEGCSGQTPTTWEFGLDHPEYRKLLRDYFFCRLPERIHDRIHLHIKAALTDNPELRFSHDVHAAPQVPIKFDPKKILADANLTGFRDGKGTAGIYGAVINPVIDLFEKAFLTVLEKADNRFLFVSHQVNLLRDASADLDTLDRLPSGEGLFRQYIDELKRVFTLQQWEYAKRLLLVLAAGEEAHKTDFNLSDRAEMELEWNGLPLGVISDLMGEPDTGSARLIFVLYSVKEVLSTWRSGNQDDSRYRLGLKDFAAVIRSEWQDELVSLHREIAEVFYAAWKKRFKEIDIELPGNNYCFRYLLMHAALCENPEIKDLVWSDEDLADAYGHFAHRYYDRSLYRSSSELTDRQIIIYSYLVNIKKDVSKTNNLAGAYMKRGVVFTNQGRNNEAIVYYNRAIKLWEGLRKDHEKRNDWSTSMSDDLAGAYVNRGVAFYNQGHYDEAISDYGRAIELIEGLYEKCVAQNIWTSAIFHCLATAYMNRGIINDNQGCYGEALSDYNHAIKLMEGIRQDLETSNEWTSTIVNELAKVYMNRGNLSQNQGYYNEAIADHGRAIELMEALRKNLEERNEWTPSMANVLAGAYMNRGNAFDDQGRYNEAVSYYNQAIKLRERIRKDLETINEWTPTMVNDLVSAYMNRGNAYQNQGYYNKAIADYGHAIKLREGLRQDLVERNDWTPTMVNDLASAYMNRGNAYQNQGYYTEAITDYGHAIKLRDGLRMDLEARNDWTLTMVNDLASAYMNRGNTYSNHSRYDEAITDYDRAIGLMEWLCKGLENQNEWTPTMIHSLAITYVNRGNAYDNLGRYDEAFPDYGQAIGLMEGLRQDLLERNEWSPSMANDLAKAYVNRGFAFRNQDRYDEAFSDYGQAIELMEGLRQDLEIRNDCTPAMANDLAGAYMKRGIAFDNQGRYDEAITDYGHAIKLIEGFRQDLEDRKEWTPDMANLLACIYMKRGIALMIQTRYDEALADYGCSIRLREELLKEFENQKAWPPGIANELAATYMNRGIAFDNQGRYDEAIVDYGRAIKLMEGLRKNLEVRNEWPPSMANDLAGFYIYRGNTFQNQGCYSEAISDYKRAIKLMEGLRNGFENRGEWKPQIDKDLAGIYMNRGLTLINQGRYNEAIADYDRAIKLTDRLRKWFEARNEWDPTIANDLAKAYVNRGVALMIQDRYYEAITDYGRVIKLREELRIWLEGRNEWPPDMANDLATAYLNRGIAYDNHDGHYNEAFSDYSRAIELMERLVFEYRFTQAIPFTVIAFYNAVLLTNKLDNHKAIIDIFTQARSFMKRLGLMVDVVQLPDAWLSKLNDLQSLIDETN